MELWLNYLTKGPGGGDAFTHFPISYVILKSYVHFCLPQTKNDTILIYLQYLLQPNKTRIADPVEIDRILVEIDRNRILVGIGRIRILGEIDRIRILVENDRIRIRPSRKIDIMKFTLQIFSLII